MKRCALLLTAILIITISWGYTQRGKPHPKKTGLPQNYKLQNTNYKQIANGNKTIKKTFIISTDMGIDDCLAILYLHQHPSVDIKAITVCGNGLAFCGPGVRNVQGLMALGWPWNIPVTCGRQQPLKYNHTFPGAWRQQCSTLMGVSLPANPFPPSSLSAVDLIITTIKKSQQKVVLLALGPLTDVAEALQKEPSIKNNLEMIYIMGGAVKVSGNVEIPGLTDIKNKFAEFNIYIDPAAADIVFKSGAPITLVPLDACNLVPMDMDFYKALAAKPITPQADFVTKLLSKNLDMINSGFYYLWDPLTAVIATDETTTTIKKMRISVVTAKGNQCGRTMESPQGNPMRVCIAAKNKPVKSIFQEIINGQ